MLQLQYFNSKLKNKHINSILDNYKLKYSGIKTELSSKLNELIKLFLKDILSFLENVEEVANTKKKVNNYEKMKSELESIRVQLKSKMLNEQKIKNDLEALTQENSLLKVKIKSLNQKLNYIYTNNTNTNNKISQPKSPLISKASKDINYTMSKIGLRSSFKNDIYVSDFRKKLNNSMDRKTLIENSINKLDLSLTSKFDYSSRVLEKVEKSNSKIKKINHKKPNILSLRKSYIKKEQQNSFFTSNNNNNNNDINNNNKDIISKKRKNIKKFLMNKEKPNNNKANNSNMKIINNKIKSCTPFSPYIYNSNKKNFLKNKDSNLYSLNNSDEINQETNTKYEDIEKKINNAIDNELKQLEQDEEKIKKLLEKINNGNSSDINININENNNINNCESVSIID